MFWLQQDIFYSLKLLLKCWRVNRCCMKQTGRLIKSACGRDRTCCCKSVVLTSLELGILLSAFASLSYSKCASPYLPWTVSSLHLTLYFPVTLLLGFWLTSPTLAGHRMASGLKWLLGLPLLVNFRALLAASLLPCGGFQWEAADCVLQQSSSVNLEKNLRNPFRSTQFLQILLLIFLPFTLSPLPWQRATGSLI